MKSINVIRSTATALILALVVTLSLSMFAFAATWTDSTIGQGAYKYYVSSDGTVFDISSSTTVSHSITFKTVARSTVKAGYYNTDTSKHYSTMSGNGTKSVSKSYTISAAGDYKFYIYNGSSDSITVDTMRVVF